MITLISVAGSADNAGLVGRETKHRERWPTATKRKRFLYLSWQVAKLGSNANNGLNAGVTYWNLNNSSANDNINIGSQLSLLNSF